MEQSTSRDVGIFISKGLHSQITPNGTWAAQLTFITNYFPSIEAVVNACVIIYWEDTGSIEYIGGLKVKIGDEGCQLIKFRFLDP
jgi:hypothetical protein